MKSNALIDPARLPSPEAVNEQILETVAGDDLPRTRPADITHDAHAEVERFQKEFPDEFFRNASMLEVTAAVGIAMNRAGRIDQAGGDAWPMYHEAQRVNRIREERIHGPNAIPA